MALINDWIYYSLAEVDSTNDAIKKYCENSGKKIVLSAQKQTAGRGRRGRNWCSLNGNLFFSMAFEYDIREAGKLSFISSLSLLQALKSLSPVADILLKWPNDVLLNQAKVSGILLEKGNGAYIIIGIGVNIARSPQLQDSVYKTVSLADAAVKSTPAEVLSLFMKHFLQNLSLLQTKGFAVLRDEWLKYAKNLGQEIIVRQNGKTEKGIFEGIDEDAALLLKTSAGQKRILAGDIFFDEIKENE
ncbi:MAG: biotin--[acetyl-CoA-carboxylase] ligase [Pseudomonadota bacterium]|nr:biotin--[acetyl-CoA-carboxylase] ligase [Pseudomonadota bacterium]